MMTKLFARLARARLARPAAVVALALTALGPGSTSIPTTAADIHRPYVVALGGSAAVKADRPIAEVESALRERQRADVMAELERETSAGKAADASYDADAHAVRVRLTDAGKAELAGNPNVVSIAPADAPRAAAQAANVALPPPTRSAQAISSVNFVQVNTPFVWGRTSIGGLSVTLTLEDSAGNVKGVAQQTTQAAPNNLVKIDHTQNYYETMFVDPSGTIHPYVAILPGDRVHVVTTGQDPTTRQSATDDRRVVVDNLKVWSSYENDKIWGTAPAGSSITVTSGLPQIAGYLTPGTNLTYADTTAAADGSFLIDKFRTTASAATSKPNLQQGSTGFVRILHSDGNEVYTVHGQNVFVPETASVVHGWAFQVPTPPAGLETGVASNPRPAPRVTVTLKSSGGLVKATGVGAGSSILPYVVDLGDVPVVGGDTVDVAFWGVPMFSVSVGQLSGALQTGSSTMTGTAPANTALVLGAGKLQGYISAQSFFDFVQQRLTSDGSGNFASPTFACGTTHLTFRPGSFGYVGYEDAKGNFIYLSIAVPVNQVMVDYPFMEGWVGDGSVHPDVTIQGQDGATKQHTAVSPTLLWLTNLKLYNNVYYQLNTSQFIVPGDSVRVSQGSWTSQFSVDKLTAWIDTDSDSVVGEAPSGGSMRVIPASDRTLRAETTAVSGNSYRAGSPFTQVSSICGESQKAVDLAPGDSGRAYLSRGDGNEVFAAYGRSMHVDQNENYVELYQWVWHGLDWDGLPPQRTATLTLTPRQGLPVTVQTKADIGHPGKTRIYVLDAQNQRQLIRAGDAISVTFDEGPEGLTRPVTLSLAPQALVTGSPDTTSGAIAGVGPKNWTGRVALNPQPTVPGQPLTITGTTAYLPVAFSDSTGPIAMVYGYSGTVSFTNTTGARVWTAWAVTAVPVKFTGLQRPGDTRVCGTGPASTSVRIHDLSTDGVDLVIGSGSIDASGHWCADVSALTKSQVIVAEADGVYSQPVIVGGLNRVFIQVTTRGVSPA